MDELCKVNRAVTDALHARAAERRAAFSVERVKQITGSQRDLVQVGHSDGRRRRLGPRPKGI